MCVYVCVCVCMCLYVCMYVFMCMHARVYKPLLLQGCDLVHGTPVLDVKPYVRYSDCPAFDHAFKGGGVCVCVCVRVCVHVYACSRLTITCRGGVVEPT